MKNKDNGDLEYHMANKFINKKNLAFERYFKFVLKSDIKDAMSNHGKIPKIGMSDYVQQMHDNADLQDQIDEIKKEYIAQAIDEKYSHLQKTENLDEEIAKVMNEIWAEFVGEDEDEEMNRD